MNEIEIRAHFEHCGSRDYIEIQCSKCNSMRRVQKENAIKNAQRHEDSFLCPKCSYTNEGKARMSKGASYKRSPETKQKMSESAHKKWQTEWGEKQKKRLAKLTAAGHQSAKYDKSKVKVLYISAKNGGEIRTCLSSYEYIYCEDFLEKDPDVISYQTQVPYSIDGREHSMDFLIQKTAGEKTVEVKVKKRVGEEKNIIQLADSEQNARQNGREFELLTEHELNITNYKEAKNRAQEYNKEHHGIDHSEYYAKKLKEKTKTYYDKNIKDDKISVFCETCQTIHEVLRTSYEKNIASDKHPGEYWCERKGGMMGGKAAKPKKANPYAADGKKQCNECKEIKPFTDFSPDKHKRDGYSTRCKPCRARGYRKSSGRF